MILISCPSLPDCQLLVHVAVGPVAGSDALVLRQLEVLLPDAPVLTHLDNLLALLDTQQVWDDEALKQVLLPQR